MSEQAETTPSAPALTLERTRILVPSPIGALGMELTDEVVTGLVIVPVGKDRKTFTPLGELPRGSSSEGLDEIVGRLSEFLAGARRRMNINYDLDAAGVSGFAKRVFRETARIPYGRTRTYQQIAVNCGRPDAYRQVLSTLTSNPIPLLVPCHRVVPTKTGIGSYVSSAKKKAWLLRLESRGLSLLP